MGVSRSELYTSALRALLERESDESITARLDAVYENDDSRLPEAFDRGQRRAVAERW
jgi:hypothetical protein